MQKPKHSRCYFYDENIGNYHYASEHPMKPFRIQLTHDILKSYDVLDKYDIYTPSTPSFEVLTTFHTDEYVNFLKYINLGNLENHKEQLTKFNINEDSPVFPGLWDFCQTYTGGSIDAAKFLGSGRYVHAINWAGGLHHGKKQEASGFCYLNDCVLAALELLRYYNRVLYIDIDIHHGDGVEEAFYLSPRVMSISFHNYGDYFPGTGAITDIGISSGKGYAVNVPLKDGVNDLMFEELFNKIFDLVMQYYIPDAIILQSGADSLAGDKLGSFNLTNSGHSAAIRRLSKMNIPLLILGGGGYTLRNVPRCWAYETSLLADQSLDTMIPDTCQHRYYYAPDYSISLNPLNIFNLNSQLSIHKIVETISENFRNYVYPVSAPVKVSNEAPHPSDLTTMEDLETERHERYELC